LFFRSEDAVEAWCERRSIARGEILTLEQCWVLAQRWYEDRMSPNWKRRSAAEADAIFRAAGLTGSFWSLE